MSLTPRTMPRLDNRPYGRMAACVIIGLLLLRLGALMISPLGLHGDEAQYWAWSKNLDWGFFTKPPLIAVVIKSTTALFGDAEWAVRLASPLLHAGTATVIFLTGRTAFDAQTGFWSALIYLLMPALWLSSSIISTDVPLLFCWAVALHAWVHLRNEAEVTNISQRRKSWGWAVQMGIAIGLGTLAKYAMLFFLPGLFLAALLDPPTRHAMLSRFGLVVAAVSTLIVSPNLLWNLENDFATLSHTASNADMSEGPRFDVAELFKFIGDQLGVFGPVSFALLILAFIWAFRRKRSSGAPSMARNLAMLSLVPLIVISVQALASRANANWAVTAYVGGSLLTAHFAVLYWPQLKAWLIGSLIVQTMICASLAGIMLSPGLTNAVGLTNPVKRLRAWPETVAALDAQFQNGHEGQAFTAYALDDRITFYSLNYYALGESAPLRMWMYARAPHNQAELSYPLTKTAGPVLLINYHDRYEEKFREDFGRLTPLPPLDIDLRGGQRRRLKLWAGYDYTPTPSR